VKIYTRAGDDGTTGLYFGGRVPKTDAAIEVNGDVDEAQACLGWARAIAGAQHELNGLLIEVERDLWVLMAEVATSEENRRKLVAGKSLVTAAMVERLETEIDRLAERTTLPTEFVVPGESTLSAALDVARTVVRRAERRASANPVEGSHVLEYLNRLSDLVWAMARFVDGAQVRTARDR
jgi:cob(I)alamin adenosyltransferase